MRETAWGSPATHAPKKKPSMLRAPGLVAIGGHRRALRHAVMPLVDHFSSNQLSSLAGAGDDSSSAFDVCRMDGHGPLVPLDPGTDRVSDPPVLHRRVLNLDGPRTCGHILAPDRLAKGKHVMRPAVRDRFSPGRGGSNGFLIAIVGAAAFLLRPPSVPLIYSSA